MGCGPSKQRDPQTVDAWLRQLGLPQYIPAFKAAGYDDLATLAHLNRADLKCVEQVTGEPVLPGHQKRLLLAAPQLRELRAHKRRAGADVAAPDLVPADSASNSALQESVGQLSNTTGAASQVGGNSTPSTGQVSPTRSVPPQRPAPAPKALGRQRAPSIQARARLWSPGLPAAAPAGAAAVAADADKAGQALVPAQKENLNPQASPAQSIGSFPGPTVSGTFVVERPPEPEPDNDDAQGGMGSYMTSSHHRARSASELSRASADSSGSRMTSSSVSNAPVRRAGPGRGRGRGPPAAPKGPPPRWSSGIKGKAWDHEVPPLARGSRSSSGDGAVRHPDEIKVRLAERAAARREASEGLRAHLRAMRTVTAELAAEEAERSPSKPVGPEWDTTIAESTAAAAAAEPGGAAGAANTPRASGSYATAEGMQGAASGSSVASGGEAGSPPRPTRAAGNSDEGGFVQILVPAAAPRYAPPVAPAHGAATVGGAGSFGSPAEVPQFAGAATYPPQAASPPHEPTLRLHPGQQLPGTPITQAAAAELTPDWTPWPVTCQPLRSSPPQTPVMFQGVQQPTPFAGGLPAGYSPVAAADATPPPRFAPSATIAEATGIAAHAAPTAVFSPGRSRDAESALQAAGRSVRARLGAHTSVRPSPAPVTPGSVTVGSVSSSGSSARVPPAPPGAPMQANLLYDSSPPPRPPGLRHFPQPPPHMASPSMRPPAVSPMVRGARPPQLAARSDSPSTSGSTGSSSVGGPQVVLKGIEDRVRRRMQQHGVPA